MDIHDMDTDIQRARVIAKDLLKTHSDIASVLITHRIKLINKVMVLESEIEILPSKRFYKSTGETIGDDASVLAEIQESKEY